MVLITKQNGDGSEKSKLIKNIPENTCPDWLVFGLRRSGHHAIANWVVKDYPIVRHYNSVKMNYKCHGGTCVYHGEIFDKKEFIKGDYPVLFTIESSNISYVMECISFYKPKKIYIVLRDPWNTFASFKKKRGKTFQCDFERDLWIEYADFVLNIPDNINYISYNDWVNRDDRSDKINAISKTSFKNDYGFNERWRKISEYLERYIEDEELLSKSKILFPDVTEEVLNYFEVNS